MANFREQSYPSFQALFSRSGFLEPHHLYIFEQANVKANVKLAK